MIGWICPRCKTEKDRQDFYPSAKRGAWCKSCMLARKRENRDAYNARTRELYGANPRPSRPLPTEKVCVRCGVVFPYTSEHFGTIPSVGAASVCVGCKTVANDKWMAEHREERIAYSRRYYHQRRAEQKDATLRRQYGIGMDDYSRMAREQGGRCAICNRRDTELVVDHCHVKGHVRALLCNKCNLGIGLFGDDPGLLTSAAAYLISTASETPVISKQIGVVG